MDTSNGLNMKGEVPEAPPMPILEINRQRQELISWFKNNAPDLGKLYEGALRMVLDHTFPGRYRFVAHAVREIRNKLPDIFNEPKESGNVDYAKRVDKIVKMWESAGFSFNGTIPQSLTQSTEIPKEGHKNPRRLFVEIASLLKDHSRGQERNKEKGYRLFEGIAPENPKLRSELNPIVEQWNEVFIWFMEIVHVRTPQKEITVNDEKFLQNFLLFETTLMAFVGSFDRVLEGIDEILEDANN